MGKSQRTKGHGFEREIVIEAKAFGLDAKRSVCSFGDDLTIDGQAYECKRRKAFPDWFIKPLLQGRKLILRGDRQESYVVLPLKEYFEILEAHRKAKGKC